jgi:hypothetical protein
MEKLLYLALGAFGYHLYKKYKDPVVGAAEDIITSGQDAAQQIQGAAQQATQAASNTLLNAQQEVFKITDPLMREFLTMNPLRSVSMTAPSRIVGPLVSPSAP